MFSVINVNCTKQFDRSFLVNGNEWVVDTWMKIICNWLPNRNLASATWRSIKQNLHHHWMLAMSFASQKKTYVRTETPMKEQTSIFFQLRNFVYACTHCTPKYIKFNKIYPFMNGQAQRTRRKIVQTSNRKKIYNVDVTQHGACASCRRWCNSLNNTALLLVLLCYGKDSYHLDYKQMFGFN